MRLIVLYDLPQSNYEDNKEYIKFRKFLQKCGFRMFQFSVYIRECINEHDAAKIINRIENNPPKEGNVSIIRITEKQFQEIIYLKGENMYNDYNKKTIFVE